MPANTERISQPAISSASSTARWMDCTVDSMFTTTPFFSPREGCEPTPSTSICPSAATSPTRATTLDVPISRPTISPLSERLAIAAQPIPFGRSGAPPADREAVGVAHVDIGDIVRALGYLFERRAHERLEALFGLAAA